MFGCSKVWTELGMSLKLSLTKSCSTALPLILKLFIGLKLKFHNFTFACLMSETCRVGLGVLMLLSWSFLVYFHHRFAADTVEVEGLGLIF